MLWSVEYLLCMDVKDHWRHAYWMNVMKVSSPSRWDGIGNRGM